MTLTMVGTYGAASCDFDISAPERALKDALRQLHKTRIIAVEQRQALPLSVEHNAALASEEDAMVYGFSDPSERHFDQSRGKVITLRKRK